MKAQVIDKVAYKQDTPPPQSSSRNLENLSNSLGFLNIRDPGRCLNQNFPGSRRLRKAKSHFRSEAFLNSGMMIGGKP